MSNDEIIQQVYLRFQRRMQGDLKGKGESERSLLRAEYDGSGRILVCPWHWPGCRAGWWWPKVAADRYQSLIGTFDRTTADLPLTLHLLSSAAIVTV
jgi:hypothetical protein